MPEYLEKDLINDFQLGQKNAFDELYNRYYSMIYVFCYKLTENQQESQDITIETMNKLFLKRLHFDNLPNIKAFLYITARNRCLGYFRHLQVIAQTKKLIVTLLSEEDDDNDRLDAEYLVAVKKSIDVLPHRQREAIELLYFTGQKVKIKEVAARMNISEKAVKRLRQRGITLLRGMLHATRTADAITILGFFVTIFQ